MVNFVVVVVVVVVADVLVVVVGKILFPEVIVNGIPSVICLQTLSAIIFKPPI